MAGFEQPNFNNILHQIIKKSLFTERQVEIILNHKNLVEIEFGISKGAYFRQVSQSRNKLIGLYYSIILFRGLGVILPDDMDLIYDIRVDAKCEIMLFYHDKSQINVVTCDVSRNS